ncbi:hypothetical protein [uncultured Schumannella sp.]|uniref:hypothetical protein n=1 Tax=uncultured Schumannella sp. TaxID=1195956 RepID=UPI0025FB4125|nr:hypothetical protein [uncultured Schumannella sp.]
MPDWITPIASSALVAGAVGATLAILGNFWIQSAAARRERRRYVAKLAADFLSHDASLVFNMAQQRRLGPVDGAEGEEVDGEPEVLVGIDGHMRRAWTAGAELSLVAPAPIAFLVQAVSGTSSALLVQSVASDDEVWRQSMIEHGHARLQLMHAVRRFVKAGRMTDAELGHDAIDVDDPRNTHTP